MAVPRPKRVFTFGFAVGAAGVTLGILIWPTVWHWVSTKRIRLVNYYPPTRTRVDMPFEGFVTVKRWGGPGRINPAHGVLHGVVIKWSIDTGFKAQECVYQDDRLVRRTDWDVPSGQVGSQSRHSSHSFEQRTRPPWWWGVTDQTEPTLPQDADWRR